MQKKGLPQEWLYELKSRNDIISVISSYITLNQKGKSYWACCPFHHEKTPSFAVNDTEQYYHCFGCGESGDIISFVEKMESCDFFDAIEILAKRANMSMPTLIDTEDIVKKKKLKDRMMELLDKARQHYYENLKRNGAEVAVEYIKSRGITGQEVRDFQIGYSLNWIEMVNYLSKLGFSKEEMKTAGIAECKGDNYYDTMANRLMFPIFNTFNECVGFSARALSSDAFAKYKNTSQTVVFDKSRAIFGIQNIRNLKQQGGLKNIIIVEGQIDVISMYKAGFKNSVACMGTALTNEHAKILGRFSEEIVLCFDGDGAGIKATIRSIEILKEANLTVRVVILPDKMDPDEFIKANGNEAMNKMIENAVPATDYLIYKCFEGVDINQNKQKIEFVTKAMEIVQKLKHESEKQVYLELIRKLSGVPIDILRRDLDKQNYETNSPNEVPLTANENNIAKSLKYILASFLHKKDYVDYEFDLRPFLKNGSYVRLYDYLMEEHKKSHNPIISTLYDMFDMENEPNIEQIINFDFTAVDGKSYFEDCINTLKSFELEEKQKILTETYKKCNDVEKRKQIAVELFEITKQMKNNKMGK